VCAEGGGNDDLNYYGSEIEMSKKRRNIVSKKSCTALQEGNWGRTDGGGEHQRVSWKLRRRGQKSILRERFYWLTSSGDEAECAD